MAYIYNLPIRKVCSLCASQSHEGSYSLYLLLNWEQFSEKCFNDRCRDGAVLVGFRFSLSLSDIEPWFWAQNCFFYPVCHCTDTEAIKGRNKQNSTFKFLCRKQTVSITFSFCKVTGPKAWGTSIITPGRNALLFIMAKGCWKEDWFESQWTWLIWHWLVISPWTTRFFSSASVSLLTWWGDS